MSLNPLAPTTSEAKSAPVRLFALLLLGTLVFGACSDDKKEEAAPEVLIASCDTKGEVEPGEVDPQAETLRSEGQLAYDEGRTADALKKYEEALKLDPTNPLALLGIGSIYQLNGDTVEAEKCYRAALKSDPAFGLAMFELAILRENAGDSAEAEKLYRQAIALNDDDRLAHHNLGFLLKENGNIEGCQEELDRAVELGVVFAPGVSDCSS